MLYLLLCLHGVKGQMTLPWQKKYIVSHRTVPYSNAIDYIIMYHIVLYRIILYRTLLHCIALYRPVIASYRIVSYRIINTLSTFVSSSSKS